MGKYIISSVDSIGYIEKSDININSFIFEVSVYAIRWKLCPLQLFKINNENCRLKNV